VVETPFSGACNFLFASEERARNTGNERRQGVTNQALTMVIEWVTFGPERSEPPEDQAPGS